MLDCFSAPYYNSSQTSAYNKIHPENQVDSIFEKIYFSETQGQTRYPNGSQIRTELLLPFNPGRNEYVSSAAGSSMNHMLAIFAPTNEAMTNYYENGSGVILKNRFGSWENTPDYIIMKLLKRHLRESFLETVPGRFEKLVDGNNSPIPIEPEDIASSYVPDRTVWFTTQTKYIRLMIIFRFMRQCY